MSKFNHKNIVKVGWLNLDTNSIIVFAICIIVLFFVGKIFVLPLKKILKLIINSILGGGVIYIINVIGESFNLHIGLNIGTSIFVGFFGIPGAILLIILKLMI